VNLEPSVLAPESAVSIVAQAAGAVDLVIEITERALLHRPAELLRAVKTLRAAGYAIALDDVGANPDSLALLPFVAPDIIKLDLSLVQRWHDADQAAIYHRCGRLCRSEPAPPFSPRASRMTANLQKRSRSAPRWARVGTSPARAPRRAHPRRPPAAAPPIAR